MNGTSALLNLPTPARRVELVEFVRSGIRGKAAERGRRLPADLPLSEPSMTWLKRMRASLVDEQVSPETFAELKDVFLAYLGTLNPVEAEDLERRVREFDQAKHAIMFMEVDA